MTDFADLAARIPHHNPAACTRVPCGKCVDRGNATPPPTVDHQPARHTDRTASPFTPLPPILRRHAPHVTSPELTKTMVTLADTIQKDGTDRWRRLLAWEDRTLPHGISLVRDEPGPDEDDEDTPRPSVSLLEEQYRTMEASASRGAQRAREAAARLPGLLDQLPRSERHVRTLVWRLLDLLTDAEARRNKTGPDQGCRSHARIGVYEPIHTGRYAHFCRFCGEWKAAEGEMPPLALLRWKQKNPGRRGIPAHVLKTG